MTDNAQIVKWTAGISLLCAFIVILATWGTWGSVDANVLGTTNYNGLQFVSDNFWKDIGGSQRYAGEIGLILGIFTLILAAVALYRPASSRWTGAIDAFLMLIVFIYGCYFAAWNPSLSALSSFSVGYGAYLSVVMAFIALCTSIAQSYYGPKA
ncbi:MAG: hypothetical protein WCQ63_03850 [Methanomethylophilus sp.]